MSRRRNLYLFSDHRTDLFAHQQYCEHERKVSCSFMKQKENRTQFKQHRNKTWQINNARLTGDYRADTYAHQN